MGVATDIFRLKDPRIPEILHPLGAADGRKSYMFEHLCR